MSDKVPIVNEALQDNRMRAATYISNHDGDTAWMHVDVMPRVTMFRWPEFKIRVHGYNAAELNEAEGPRMGEFFREKLQTAKEIRIRIVTTNNDRIVADVYLDGVMFYGELHQALRRLRGMSNG